MKRYLSLVLILMLAVSAWAGALADEGGRGKESEDVGHD